MNIKYVVPVVAVLVALGFTASRRRVGDAVQPSSADASSAPADGPSTVITTPGARAPAAATDEPGESAEHDRLVRDLRATRACYESESCDLPKDDPRAYDFAVGRRLAAQLAEYRERFGASHPAERALLAREYMGVDDGFVREQLLGMLEGLPPNADDLATLAEGLRVNADPELVKQALPILVTYVGTPDAAAAHELVRDMLRGPQFAGVETSLGILPFVDDDSLPGYRALVDELPPGSTVARNLRAALAEYARRRGGG